MDERTILSFSDLGYYYKDGHRQVNILKHASYDFEKGKIYAIVGTSGSGKTTLLVLAGGLDSPKEGKVLYCGQDIQSIGLTKYCRDNVSIVFQSYNLIHYMNAIQNVTIAMDISHISIPHKKQKALEILQKLGLSEEESQRDIRQLSGGQQQRVAIARAIAKDVDLILCDEPTGNLDEETSQGIIQAFIDLAHKENKCVIVVTHSKTFASCLDVQLKICQGQLLEINE
jgi:putative ABC transport system ATP-binding protein